MSRWEEERGEIKLPSAEFAAVRQAVQAAVAKDREKTLKMMERAYSEAPKEALRNIHVFEEHLYSTVGSGWTARPRYDFPDEDLRWRLSQKMVGEGGRLKKPRAAFLGPAPTNRTLSFDARDGVLIFDPKKKTVLWAVDSNNHAVDHARNTTVFGAFMEALTKVKWTRGTGGVFAGNDEYHSEAREVGSGGAYCTGAFGPIGAEEEPNCFEPFTDSAGVRHSPGNSSYATKGLKQQARLARATAKALTAMAQSSQGRVGRGVPAGGQFAGRYYGEDTIRLG